MKHPFITLFLFLLSVLRLSAFQPDATKLYRLESRHHGWVALHNGTGAQVIFDAVRNVPEMRFQFIDQGTGFYKIRTEFNTDLLTVNGSSTADGASITFEGDSGTDNQLWQLVNLGDGYVRLVAKHSGLTLAHTQDSTEGLDQVNNDSVIVQYTYDGSDSMQWLIAESYPTANDNIGVNQAGYTPGQRKIVTYTKAAGGAAPAYNVTGPQTQSGTMTNWGTKWGITFYTADISALSTEGRYNFSTDGLNQEFEIVEGSYNQIRGIHGGQLKWSDMVHSFLQSQFPPFPVSGDSMSLATGDENFGYTPIAGTHTLTDGYYDATSRDSKVARTATAAKFIALAMLESDNSSKKTELLPAAQMLVDHFAAEQNPDGSFPLGKFRTGTLEYHWSTDTGTGIASRCATAMALLAQALEGIDDTRASTALSSAQNAWTYMDANPNAFIIDDPGHAGLLQDYYGSQANTINAAIELYIATGNATYASYADSHIKEAVFASGVYKRNTLPDWPGSSTPNKMDIMVDANTPIHLARYFTRSDAVVRANISSQLQDWNDYWQTQVDTPWMVPENGGAPGVVSGWSRNLCALLPQFLKVAHIMGWTDARDSGTAIIDYLLGNNAIAASFYMGAGKHNFQPRFKHSSDKTKGAIIPGVRTEFGLLSLNGQASKYGEAVTMVTTPMLYGLELADSLFPASTGNKEPFFYSGSMNEATAFVGVPYSASLADNYNDFDGDNISFSKTAGPTWLIVSADGTLSGTPTGGDLNLNTFTVLANDGSDTQSATLLIDVRNPLSLPATQSYHFSTIEDTYVAENNPTDNYGNDNELRLRSDAGSAFSRMGLLKFDVSGASGTIASVSLNIYSIDETDTINVHSIADTSWQETVVTYASMPTFGPVIGSGSTASGSWLSVDITPSVTGNGTYAFGLDEQANSLNDIGSREGGFAAYLNITMTAPAPNNNPPTFLIDPIGLPNAIADSAYADTLSTRAFDPDGDTLSFTKLSGPTWLNVAANGSLSGTPLASDIGLSPATISVSDGNGNTDTAILNIIVTPSSAINNAPTFTSDPFSKPDATVASPYSESILANASDPESDPITFTKISGPTWLAVAGNGDISGTPAGLDLGLNEFVVKADDGNGNTATATLRVTVQGEVTNWTTPYDGTGADTIWLWHMDDSEFGASIGQLNERGDMARSPAGGKFAQGVCGDGAAGGNTNDGIRVEGSDTAGNVFPSGADPSLTIEGWFKFNDLTIDQSLFKKTTGGATPFTVFHLKYDVSSNVIRWDVGDPPNTTGNRLEVDASFLTTGQWYHVAATWDAANDLMQIFVDGIMLGSANAPGTTLSDSNNLLLIGGTGFDGCIDEVRMSDKALTYSPPPLPGPPIWAASPTIKADACSSADYNNSITVGVDVTDPEGDTITFSKISGPSWLNISGAGLLTGVAQYADIGVNNFTIRADDGNGNSADTTLQITVLEASVTWGMPYNGSDPNTIRIWHMDDSELGNTNTGELTLLGDTATNPAGGKVGFGQTIEGDGIAGTANDRINVTGSDTIGAIYPATADPSFTIEGWFNFDNLASDRTLFRKQSNAASNVFQLKYISASDELRFDVGSPVNTGGNRLEVTPTGLSTGTWFHIAGTWDAVTDTISIYVNGNRLGSSTASGLTVPDIASKLIFGGTSTVPMDGSIDEVRLSDKAIKFAPPASGAPVWAYDPLSKADATATVAYTGESVLINIDVLDPEDDTVTYTKTAGPTWLAIDLNSGALSGTPSAGDAGLNAFTIRANDGNGNTTDNTLNITVTGAPAPYDAWETANGISGSGRASDPDNDGFTNEYEFYFGLNPNSNVNARQASAGIDSNAPTVQYTYRTDAPAITYTVETSTNLSSWSTAASTAISGPTPNGDGTSTITVRSDTNFATQPKQFFRIKAEE